MNRKSDPIFELNHVLIDGVFYAATKVYGITFKERKDLPVYLPDVRVFEVFDADGTPLAHLHRRLLRAAVEARRRLDERIRRAKQVVRHEAGHRQSSQHSETARRPADPAHLGRSAHRVSRIRSRAARHVLEREVSALQRNERAARFRRVSVAGQRDVAGLAGGPAELREALSNRASRCRRSCSTRCSRRKNSIRASRRPNISRPRCSIRPGIN